LRAGIALGFCGCCGKDQEVRARFLLNGWRYDEKIQDREHDDHRSPSRMLTGTAVEHQGTDARPIPKPRDCSHYIGEALGASTRTPELIHIFQSGSGSTASCMWPHDTQSYCSSVTHFAPFSFERLHIRRVGAPHFSQFGIMQQRPLGNPI